MRTHYVPQHYLKGFCSAATPAILSRYEKGSRKVLTTTTKNLAQQCDLYPAEVEEFLATQIEQPANAVLDRIKERVPLAVEDKAVLASYMMTMLKRVPHALTRLEEAAPKAMESVLGELDAAIANWIAEDPSKAEILTKRRDEARQICARYEASLPREFWYDLIPPETAPRALAALGAMTWRFLTFDQEPEFMTSDNPVFFFEGIGIGYQHSEVTFPISKNIVLWATWRTDLEEGFFPTSQRIVREINSRTVSAATRYVFYSQKVKWVVSFVNRNTFVLNRIV